MKAYPNPTHNKLNVEFNSATGGQYIVRMFDLTGRLVVDRIHTTEPGENHIELDLGQVSKGIYILSLSSE